MNHEKELLRSLWVAMTSLPFFSIIWRGVHQSGYGLAGNRARFASPCWKQKSSGTLLQAYTLKAVSPEAQHLKAAHDMQADDAKL